MATQLLCGSDFSLPAIMLVLVMHLPYAFTLRPETYTPGIELRIFRKIMTFLAVVGILQYFLQFLVGQELTFFMDFYFPETFLVPGFNTLNAMDRSSETLKSNGVFLLEASMFSQYLALGILVELLYFKKIKRLILYALALALTFSGTGLMLLAVTIPVFLMQKKKWGWITVLAVLTLTSQLWAPLIGLGNTVNRINEFSNVNTSGYARFISPIRAISENNTEDPLKFLFGAGAGSLASTGKTRDYETFNPTWGKLFYEYGLVGTLIYSSFLLYIFLTSRRPIVLKLALAVQFLLLAEYLTPPLAHCLILALLVWPPREKDIKNFTLADQPILEGK